MPRRPRTQAPGTIHHVAMRGQPTRPLFLDDQDRWRFLGLLADVTRESRWRCLAFCLMTTHYHLVVEERDVPLSRSMQQLNSRFAIAMNARYDTEGHLFRGRYSDTVVTSDEHLFATVAYVARNPCEAGLCERAADWQWSSYPALIGSARPWSFVHASYLLSRLRHPLDDLRRHVEQGSDPWTRQDATRR